MRQSGILLHISSLPGDGGIGSLGNHARRFVEFLRASGQSCWQVLPLTPPAKGNSPYSSYSVFAGNPYFIDLPALVDEHLLPEGALSGLPQGAETADFDWCESVKLPLLRQSFAYSRKRMEKQLERFRLWNEAWLLDYALFMGLKRAFDGKDYQGWPEEYRTREKGALKYARRELADETAFWEYTQFLFFSQWRALKRYANARGVSLIGDMPIYVDSDSADVWANPQVFDLDRDLEKTAVAGVPPDAFSADGQLWGNPLYNWKYLRKTKYKWWAERLKSAGALYDSVRIDHFRALSSYWAVPAGSATAKTGEWRKGPGIEFIDAMKDAVSNLSLIAEDLGLLDDDVRDLLRDSGLPGMRVLEFAFSTAEESTYLPHNFVKDCVGYIGTHDNDTLQGWMKSSPSDEAEHARQYLNITDDKNAHWDFIRGLYGTVADLVVVQMQDVLGLPTAARMNKPGIAKGNWGWRLLPEQVNADTAKRLRAMTQLYARCGKRRR